MDKKYLTSAVAVVVLVFLAAVVWHACCIYSLSSHVKDLAVAVRQTNEEIKQINIELEQTNAQLKTVNESIDKTNNSMDQLGKSFKNVKIRVF